MKNKKLMIIATSVILLGGSFGGIIGLAQENLQEQTTEYIDSTESTSATKESSTSESINDSKGEAVKEKEETPTSSTLNEPNITEENNKELGAQSKDREGFYDYIPNKRSDLSPAISARTASIDAYVSAGDSTRPAKDFVDVSSHNGNLTVANYNTMKQYGVKGVIVKLTEYTTYENPYAASQIANAKAAGLKVGVYHYSWFNTEGGARAEANYFAAVAKRLNLPADTLMVNDAEQGEMAAGNVTNNSLVFANQLKVNGYSRTMHYSMLNWFNTGVMNANTLGYNNIWVAQYPYNPLASNLLNRNYGAWQWSSELTFPGIKGVFDISIDYNDIFNGGIVYDKVQYNNPVNFNAKIKNNGEAARHTIYDDILDTKPGVNVLGQASLYAGQTVQITRIAKTVKATWYQFAINGRTIGWVNSKTFDLSTGSVYYSAYVAGNEWQYSAFDGQSAGTSSEAKRIEALKLSLNNSNTGYSGDIEYRVYAQSSGWEPNYQKNDAISGKINSGKRVEAVQIRLTGEMAKQYDVYYRTHVAKLGWLDWAKNNEKAGSVNYSYAVEDIQVLLVKKGAQPPGATATPYKAPVDIVYESHVQSIGWQSPIISNSGDFSGTIGAQKQIEAIKINTKNTDLTGTIQYQLYLQKKGWADVTENGELNGTIGEKRRAEAIKINLTDQLAKRYDIYYRVHSRSFGWLDWAKNGQEAGTAGYSLRMEALQIKIVEKAKAAPGETARPYVTK